MRTYAIINQKGGVGKSTTALSIGAGLTIKGNSVLYIDLDAQGNLSYTLEADTNTHNVVEILKNPNNVKNIIQRTKQGDIIASTSALTGSDIFLTGVGKEYKLKEALKHIDSLYDYCIIDTPPALGILTINALTACNGAIIPAQADMYSLQGINQLKDTINAVKAYCNKDLSIMGILLTRYNGRSILTKEITEMIDSTAQQLETKLYKTKIRECIAIKEAQAIQQNIFTYAPKSNAAIDYESLLTEIIEKE